MKNILLFGLLCLYAGTLFAQDATTQPKQIWPEVDIYYKLNEKFRLYSKVTASYLNNANTDGTAGVFLDFFAFPLLRHKKIVSLHDTLRGEYLWFRSGYSYSHSPPGASKEVDQNFIETTVNGRHYLPWDILMTVTNRLDWLFENSSFDPRYRPKIKFDRNFRTAYMFFNFYFYGEYYIYFNGSSQDRLRLEVGLEFKVLKFMSFQNYYLHQFANDGSVKSIDAIGVQANFYFKKKPKKNANPS